MSKKTNNQTPSTMSQLKEVAGLFTCLLEHKVQSTTARINWQGPKIPPEEWDKVLAYFQWTYDETKSESQVRMYVNPGTKTWAAWAYPQEAKTGMSARELGDHPDFSQQREQFSSSAGWLYFCTVHHHCAASAFQSSVDEANEKTIDGLHITVGDMDKARYTIHDRFYLSGQKISHDLSWFWDIGDALEKVPEWCKALLPSDIKDRLARGGMCAKPDKDTAFPQQWKDNLVYVKPPEMVRVHQGGLGYNPNWDVGGHGDTTFSFQRKPSNMPYELRRAREQFAKLCLSMNLEEPEGLAELQHMLINDAFWVGMIELMYRNDVNLERLAEFIENDIITPAQPGLHEQIKDQMNEGNGVADWDGPNYSKLPE